MKINSNQTPQNIFQLYDLKQSKSEGEKKEGPLSQMDKVDISKLGTKEIDMAKISLNDRYQNAQSKSTESSVSRQKVIKSETDIM